MDSSYNFRFKLFFLCFVFHISCFFVKVKLFCSTIMCMCIVWKGHPRNDLYYVGWNVKPYSLTHSPQQDVVDRGIFSRG